MSHCEQERPAEENGGWKQPEGEGRNVLQPQEMSEAQRIEAEQASVVEQRFLMFFYKVFLACGILGSLTSLSAGTWQAASFVFGFACVAGILFLWHLAVDVIVKPKKTSTSAQTLLVFIRYLLLGGVFYGIISLFAVQWPWFVAGTLSMITGLLISTALFKRKPDQIRN